jgi:hypothetical protein
VANVAIIAAELVTAFVRGVGVAGLIVGLGIAALNAEVAREERKVAQGPNSCLFQEFHEFVFCSPTRIQKTRSQQGKATKREVSYASHLVRCDDLHQHVRIRRSAAERRWQVQRLVSEPSHAWLTRDNVLHDRRLSHG